MPFFFPDITCNLPLNACPSSPTNDGDPVVVPMWAAKLLAATAHSAAAACSTRKVTMDLRHLVAGLVILAVPVGAASCSDSAVANILAAVLAIAVLKPWRRKVIATFQ